MLVTYLAMKVKDAHHLGPMWTISLDFNGFSEMTERREKDDFGTVSEANSGIKPNFVISSQRKAYKRGEGR